MGAEHMEAGRDLAASWFAMLGYQEVVYIGPYEPAMSADDVDV